MIKQYGRLRVIPADRGIVMEMYRVNHSSTGNLLGWIYNDTGLKNTYYKDMSDLYGYTTFDLQSIVQAMDDIKGGKDE